MILFGLALAGGQSRRMGGGDKPLLDLGGRPMLARVLDVLAAECARVAISANGDPSRFARFRLPVLNDGPFAGAGPLAGVLAGIEWASHAGADALLTIPGDTPFLSPGIAARLAPPPSYAETDGQAHPLVALWPVSAAPALRDFLVRAEARSARAFQAAINARPVAFPPAALANINTPDDLAAARERAFCKAPRE